MEGDWARPVVHFGITARDPQLVRAFYEDLFAWRFEGDPSFLSVDPGLGGPEPGPGGHLREGDPGVTLYVQVRDLAETIARAQQLGGAHLFGPLDQPGGGPTIAAITDPEGTPVGLVQQ